MKRIIPFIFVGLLLLALAAGLPADTSGGKNAADPQKVNRELHDILSRPEYNPTHATGFLQSVYNWLGSIVQNVWNAIKELLINLLKSIGLDLRGSSDLVSIIIAALIIAGFGLLIYFVMKWLAWRGREEEIEDLESEDYELPSAKPLIKQAAKLADAGDYRGAFRCAYLASISHLDEIRALRFERSRTNWEYLRDLRQGGHNSPYNHLQPLTRDFDRKFYGRETCIATDYERALNTYESISQEAAK